MRVSWIQRINMYTGGSKDRELSGVVQGYVSIRNEAVAIVLVDVIDGRSCEPCLDSVAIDDVLTVMHDRAR